MTRTCLSFSKTKIQKEAIGIECNMKKYLCSADKFCRLGRTAQFWPKLTVESRQNSFAKPNVCSVTTRDQEGNYP